MWNFQNQKNVKFDPPYYVAPSCGNPDNAIYCCNRIHIRTDKANNKIKKDSACSHIVSPAHDLYPCDDTAEVNPFTTSERPF